MVRAAPQKLDRVHKVSLDWRCKMNRLSRRQLLGHSLQLAGAATGLPLLSSVRADKDEHLTSLHEVAKADEPENLSVASSDWASSTRSKNRSIIPVRQCTGKFIWCGGEAKPYHLYLFARHSFELSVTPSTGQLHITASDRYVLFVNGAYLGRGPARSDPRRKSYDTYNVTTHLKPGRNIIAVRAFHYGETQGPTQSGNFWTVGERTGLWVQLEIEDSSGHIETIGTNSSWRVCPAQGWDRSGTGVNPTLCTVYDASKDPSNWMNVDFDDSAWEEAYVIPPVSLEWVLLEGRDTPMMEEHESFPQRIIEVGEVIDFGLRGQTDIFEVLNTEIHFPAEHAVIKSPDAVLRNDGRKAEFQGKFAGVKGIRAPYLILDFGRQLFGFPRVRLSAGRGAILDMTYGEQLQNGRMPFGYHRGDRYITRDGEQTWELSEYKQFRYLQLTLRSTFSPIQVESVSVNEYCCPARQRGRFTCSDQMMTKLWQACVDTTYLSMEDTIVCDACRERTVFYVGDGGHGILGVYIGYGDIPLTDHFLRFYPLSERGTGRLQILYPPENPWNHSIPQFYSQWSARVREHYLFAGRRAVLDELYPSVQRQIDWYEPLRDGMGLLRDLPGWNWCDWTPIDIRGANFATNAIYVKGLEDAAWLADQVKRVGDARRWRKIAEEVRNALRLNFWNAEKGFYEDSYH